MKKIFTLLALVALVFSVYYLWEKRYDYFFKGATEETNPYNQQVVNTQDEEGEEREDERTGLTSNGAQITDYDCSKRCENRKSTSSYEYCRELCGLNEGPLPEDSPLNTDDCNTLDGLDKDVCLKRQAVKEKKDTTCDEIGDEQLKQNCINRVAEEILE